MGKAARLAALYSQDEFAVFMGLVEMLLHGLTGSGISGVITGLANDVPKACVRVFDLYQKGELEEARKAQKEVSLAGELELKGGIHAMRVSPVSCAEEYDFLKQIPIVRVRALLRLWGRITSPHSANKRGPESEDSCLARSRGS